MGTDGTYPGFGREEIGERPVCPHVFPCFPHVFQDYWLQPALDRLKTELEPTAQQSLPLLLWYAQTDAADQAISAFAGDASKPSVSRTYARELAGNNDKIGSKQRTRAANSTEAELRQKRRERLRAVSDEALIDLDDYTLMLMAKRK